MRPQRPCFDDVLAKRLACLFCMAVACFGQQSPAEKLIEAGHWKRARAIVELRIHTAPDDPLANFLLSQVRNAFGERKTPLPLAEKAVALDGRTAKYHRQVAEVLGVMAQRASVFQQLLLAHRFRKEIDAAIACDPRDVQALRDLVEFYLLAPGIAGGDPQKASSIASRISDIDTAEGYLTQARVASFNKRTAEAQALLQNATGAQPPSYRAHLALAQFYAAGEQKNLSAAEAQAKEAVNLDHNRAQAYTILAAIYADRGDWSQLEAILTASAREVPDDPAPYYSAADRLISLGRESARAERYLRAYLGQEAEGNEPPAAQAHWKLGLVFEGEGRQTEAADEWQQALRLDAESPAARELRRIHRSTSKGG